MPNYKEILLKKFNEEYQKLNEEQKKAVDTIEGPVMVIAGPGTGKTQILAARIGKILMQPDSFPENILCLTYTDAGAIAMRKRLLQFIGPDAYKVNIYTFHGFCNEVIQQNLSLFEKLALNPVSDLEKIQLYKTLIDHLPKNNPLKRYRGDVYYEIKNLQKLFSAMKREGWTPEYIENSIDQYLDKIKDDENFKYKRASKKSGKEVGDYNPAYFNEVERMKKLSAAVNEFNNFQNLMKQHNLYDFDDMINWVITVFKENKNVLADYQERFQYILVDEYQDTSGTQNEIVKLLIDFWDEPNVFVVGDDDQSIYRFQGANVENMESFAKSYGGLLKIVLTNNYRSTKPILDVSKSLIDRNAERLIHKFPGLTKELKCSKEELQKLIDLPAIIEYNTIKDEMADVTNKIETLIGKGVEPGKIAVIYKENNYGEQLMRYFRLKNIPYYSKKSINIPDDPFAKKIIQILRYLVAEHDIPYGGDELLFEILHFDFYKIPPIEIAKLTVEVNNKNYNERTSIRKLLFEKANAIAKDLFDNGINPALKNFSKMMEQLIAEVSNVPLQTLFEKVISDGGVLSYIMKNKDKIRLLQILTGFFDFIKDATARNPTLDLKGLIDVIDLMKKEKIALPLMQFSGNSAGVNLLTAHGSKGLEFEHVFITGMNAHLWEKKSNPNDGYKLPDTLFSSLPSGSAEEELRRLFYVAITRAEKYLNVSFIKIKPDGKDAEHSMFVAEIVEGNDLKIDTIKMPEEELMEFEILNYLPQAPEIDKSEDDFITSVLDKYVMNVTSLNNYLDCPLGFYYKNLIRIPAGKSETLEFGSAVHYALQKLFEEMQKNEKQEFSSKEKMIEHFKWFMKRHRENFTPESFARRMEQGEIVLGDYYDQYIPHTNKIVAVERNIKNVVNGIPIKGKIDKMEFNGKEVNVVDYKTGDVNSEYTKKKLLAPNADNPIGGDYWRQAVFYKILIDNMDGKDWKVVSSEFDFVEPDKSKGFQKRKIFIEPSDITTVKQQLTEVWNKIQARDFYTGCGKEDCTWCNFVKENEIHIALHDMIEDEQEI
ncbi:MAG: ATP-dependent helicase [Bacteroidota bacterium]|nr:ATP-dependent helicase [Bacteroidota bacterium]